MAVQQLQDGDEDPDLGGLAGAADPVAGGRYGLLAEPQVREYYHCSDHCPMLGKDPQEITYGELNGEANKLKACPACGPVPRRSEILRSTPCMQRAATMIRC